MKTPNCKFFIGRDEKGAQRCTKNNFCVYTLKGVYRCSDYEKDDSKKIRK